MLSGLKVILVKYEKKVNISLRLKCSLYKKEGVHFAWAQPLKINTFHGIHLN